MGEKTRAYVLCTKTFRDIENLAKNTIEYKVELYSYKVDRSDLSEEQRRIQARNNWYSRTSSDFRIYDANLDDLVKSRMTQIVLNGYKENILDRVLDDILDIEVRFIGKINKDKNVINISTIEEIGDERHDEYDYRTDMKEFESLAKESRKNLSFSGDGDYVYLEEINVDFYAHSFNNFTKEVKKAINKYVRNNLTYCLKNGKLIIPDEYISKGERGIEEWRNIKSSKNKSNSIENRLIKETVIAKKQYAYDSVCRAMDKIVSANDSYDWTIPRLMIDGKYNKQRTQKLVAKILDTKSKQKLIEMSEQEIIDKAKEYWKQKLMNAYNELDKLEV